MFKKKKKEGRTDCKARRAWLNISQAHRPPDANTWLIAKEPDAGKNWRQKKRVTEDEMVGRHHQCNRYELRWTPKDGKGQGSLVCCSPWGQKESDMTWLAFQSPIMKRTSFLGVSSKSSLLFTWGQTMVGFPGGSDGKESACSVGDQGLIPELGRPLEKEMETHSSILAWKIPWVEEPSRQQSMG